MSSDPETRGDEHPPAGSVYGSNVDLDALPLSDAAQCFGAPTSAAEEDGHPFAREELERYQQPQLLGVGGMGQVSAVSDFRLNRQVALKELPADARDRAALERRLAQEAWITAQLEHPGIVPVYDAGRNASGRLFFTMRLIRGRSLAQALQDGDLELGSLLRHFLAVCQAVGYAHARGVVHRDLKPANIMLGGFGETQVMDWGLARPVETAGPQRAAAAAEFVPAEQAARTAVGARVGTPAYMSPEQARAEPVGPASDVWSLGAVLFEIVTGAPLFEGKSSAEIYAVLERGAPPIHELPGVEPELAAIVTCALSSETDARYGDAKGLADDIASYLDGRRVTAHTYSSWEVMKRFARSFRLPLLVATAALVTAGVVFGVSYSQTVDQRDRARAAEGEAQRALARALAAESLEDEAQKLADRAQREADTNYAAQLILKASNATLSGYQTEAEVMAAHALARSDSLWARGLLARFAASRRPELVMRTTGERRCSKRAFSPDGRAYLCRFAEGLMLFDSADGTQQWQAETEGGEFAFVTDDLVLAVDEYGDSPAALLDRTTGTALLELPIDQMATTVVAGPRVLFGDRKKLRLWSSLTLETRRLPGPAGLPRALSGDGAVALATHPKTGITVIDTTRLTAQPLPGKRRWKDASAALNRDGSRLALAGPDGMLRVVSVSDGRVVWERGTGRVGLRNVLWSPGDTWLLTRDEKELSKVFHTAGGGRLGFPSLPLDRARWSQRDGAIELISGNADELVAHRMPEAFVATTIDVGQPIERLTVSRDGTAVALAHGESTVSLLDADGRFHRRHNLGGMGLGLGVAFVGGSNQHLAVTNGISTKMTVFGPGGATQDRGGESLSSWLFPSIDGGIVAIQRRTSAALYPPKGPAQRLALPTNMVTAAAGSADGRRFAALDIKGGLVWFEATAAGLGEPKVLEPRTTMTSVALDRTGRMAVLGSGWEVTLLELDSGRVIAEYGDAPNVISAVAMSNDGTWVAAGTYRGEVIVWAAKSRRRTMIAEVHREQVVDVRFTSTGGVFYTASKDGTAARWGLSCLSKTPALLQHQRATGWGMELDDALAVQVR